MTREQAIIDIDNLFPTDSDFPATNAIGKQLLQQAIENVYGDDWRELPDEVIYEYRRLCIRKDNGYSF